MSVTASSGCSWTASTSYSWLHTTSSGSGSGTASYTLDANTTTSSRSGTLTVAGKTFTVSQAAASVSCTYSISSTSASFTSASGSGSVSVTAGSGCSWSASTAYGWIHTTSSGSGSGTASYTVDANTSTSSRSGTLTVAGQTFTVSQAAASVSCTYSLSATSASFTSAGSSGSVSVTAGSGCGWMASTAYSWIHTSSSGSGSGTASYTVDANSSTSARTGTMTIAGQTFTVNQAGLSCTYTLSATATSVAATGGSGTVSVSATSGCGWIATANVSWISITSGSTGSGNGSVGYSVAANSTTSTRSGTLTIAGKTFTVSQAAAVSVDNPPTVSLTSPGNGSTISSTVNFTGSATDDLGVTRVEFWCDGSVLLGTATSAPYAISYNTASIANGSHNFTCKAYDTTGHSTTSAANAATVSNTSVAGPWVKALGGTGTDAGRATAVDGSGNVVVVGLFQGSVNFGGATLTSAGGSDIYIAKYSAAGAHLWSTRVGGSGEEFVRAVALDASGNVFIAGHFSAQTDLGGGPLTSAGATDMFIAKYSPTGTYQWGKRFGDWSDDSAKSLAIDRSGNVVVTGFFKGVVDFGGGVLYSAYGGLDTFLVKFSATGVHLWSKNFSSDADDDGTGVAIDGSDNIVLSGHMSGHVDCGAGMLLNKGGSDFFVAKFLADGSHVWSKSCGGPGADNSIGVALDSSGNVFIVGFFTGSIDLGGGTLTTASSDDDVILAKFGPDGRYLWAKSFAGPGFEMPCGVAVDGSGNVAISGYFQYTMNLGGSPLTSASTGNPDVFVAKYSNGGSYLWSERVGGTSSDYGNAIAADATGHVITTGQFMGAADFGGQSLTSSGSSDSFLLRLDP